MNPGETSTISLAPLLRSWRLGGVAFSFLLALPSFGQTPYPPAYIRNVVWNADPHYITVPQPIISPGYELEPTTITGTTHTEFISATEVRLTPGFHAGGFSGEGRFRAWIDEGLGDPSDVIVIAPENAVSEADNMVHVPKWEKLELGLKLPEDFQFAIESFFNHYYDANGFASPSDLDRIHDLNPYADDSLQLVMYLMSPSGTPRMKWGFYMKEAKWRVDPDVTAEILVPDATSQLAPYSVRFRFAPDEVGLWSFDLAIEAPYTSTPENLPIADVRLAGYSFYCDPPLDDNNGFLRVNPVNHRTLQFAGDEEEGDETSFFGLGTNMADVRHSPDFSGDWDRFYRRDFEAMKTSMEQLHESGGNFLRMYLIRNLFAPEWVNLGVYDAYRSPGVCPGDWDGPQDRDNCQYQCWAFDQMLDHARANDIYIQLCIDPYPPIIDYEDILWGGHAYALNYLEPNRDPETGRFNMQEFFYTSAPEIGDPDVFYFWKRKYKYIMSRWGYSVNLPIIEPFNEIDQMLTYQHRDLTNADGKCNDNRLVWPVDEDLPETLDNWLTDITQFVRGEQDPDHPAASPLGERRLFLMSYTQAQEANTSDDDYFLPFRNDAVDLIDVHKGFHPTIQGPNNETDPVKVEHRMHEGFKSAVDFWATYPDLDADLEDRKPFNHGEFNYYTEFVVPDPLGGDPIWKSEVEKIFHNYDVSFHNELWSSVFSGKFAAGTTWHWERVFWWEDALVPPPFDDLNPFFHPTAGMQFSNAPGEENELLIDGNQVPIKNQSLHHHFRPLADFLLRPSVQELGILDGNYTAEEVFDNAALSPNPIECYYLTNPVHNAAIGWVHNRNASVTKSFYAKSGAGNQNFLGCAAPTLEYVDLSGFEAGHDYHIYWLPTRHEVLPMDLPDDQIDDTGDGTVRLDLSSNPLGGVLNNYLDTLHADYAFIISPAPIVKSLAVHQDHESPNDPSWDFTLHPNPSRDGVFVRLPNDAPKEIELFDPSGRRLQTWSNITATTHRLALEGLAKGVYWIRVADGVNTKSRKLLLQ